MFEISLPFWVTELLADAAARLQQVAEEPGTAAFDRLFSRVDTDADVEDPLIVLSRQTMLDEVVGVVGRSAHEARISEDEAEAWLKVLGMTLAARAAELGIRNDDVRDALGGADAQYIDIVHALQLCLLEALDGPVEP